MKPNNTSEITRYIKEDGVIIYPTETVWGLGCSPESKIGIERIYKIKNRDNDKPLLLLVDSIKMIEKYTDKLREKEVELLNSIAPTTVIIENIKAFNSLPKGPNNSIGFRVTQNNFCKKLIKALQHPLVSTSANFSGKPEPKTNIEIDKNLIQLVDFTCEDLAENRTTGKAIKPSRIVKIIDDKLIVLRA